MASISSSMQIAQIENPISVVQNVLKKAWKKVQIIFLSNVHDYPDREWQEDELRSEYHLIPLNIPENDIQKTKDQIYQSVNSKLLEDPLVDHFHNPVKMEEMKFKSFYRFCKSCRLFAEYFFRPQKRSDNINNINKLALIFLADKDHNNSFNQSGCKNVFGDLIRNGYEIVVYKPKTRFDFPASVRKASEIFRKIDFLLFWGHGEGDQIVYTDDLLFNETILRYEHLRNCMSNRAVIVLDACDTGDELAVELSKGLPWPIYAPKFWCRSSFTFYSNQAVYFYYGINDREENGSFKTFIPSDHNNITACLESGVDQAAEKDEILEMIPVKIESAVDYILNQDFLSAIRIIKEIENNFIRIYGEIVSHRHYTLLENLKKIISSMVQSRQSCDDKEIRKFCKENPKTLNADDLAVYFNQLIDSIDLEAAGDFEGVIQVIFAIQMYQKLLPEMHQQRERVQNLMHETFEKVKLGIKALRNFISRENTQFGLDDEMDDHSRLQIYILERLKKSYKKFVKQHA